MIDVTTHTIVKNEENWVWYALTSVKDFVSTMLVFDDNSSDKTREVITSIDDKKIVFSTGQLETAADYTVERNTMLEKTKTDWFVLLDGDEIWNPDDFQKLLDFLETCDKNVYGVVIRTRNCIGDIYHYLPESAGNYHLLNQKGHLTIRAYRKLPGFSWAGSYPMEAYVDDKGVPISDQPEHLKFLDVYYWHVTHLSRSSDKNMVKGWRTVRIESGIKVESEKLLPPVLFSKAPITMFDPLVHRSSKYELVASLITPIKQLKRKFKK